MVISINALAEPIGSIKSWIRPDASTSLPGGWLICDGSLVVDASSPFNGKIIPDLRSRFPRGHTTLTNLNFAADVQYFTGGTVPTGGADQVNLNHGHSNSQHNHSSPSHSHSFSGNQHSHSNPPSTSFVSQFTGATPGNQGLIGPGPGPNGHNHLIGGSVSSTTATGNVNNANASIDNNSISISSSLGFTENRPLYTELVSIIKVK